MLELIVEFFIQVLFFEKKDRGNFATLETDKMEYTFSTVLSSSNVFTQSETIT